MGFVDIIGVATGYVKQDFKLSDVMAQFLPMMVLLWFFILAVPVGVLQDKYGKRNMLNIGMVVQAIGLGLPFIASGIFLDRSERLRKYLVRRGDLISKIGGIFLIVIGVLEVTGLWGQMMNSIRSLISDFIPVV